MAGTMVTAPDGRRTALFAAGDPSADRIVLVCHPAGGSGSFDPDPVVTERWGVHLVALDRPGYGATVVDDPPDSHRIADRADDLIGYLRAAEQNADSTTQAELHGLGVVGWGTGGVVAAAIAARHPGAVSRLALVGAPTPDNAARLAQRVAAEGPSLAALHVHDEDPDLARHPGLLGRVERMIGEATVQGRAGVEADRLLFDDRGWVADLKRVRAETRIWLGVRDPGVGEDDVRWWGKRLRGARAVRVRDSGPLAIASAWRSVLAHVAPEHGRVPEQLRDHGAPWVADLDPVHPDRD